MNHFYNQVFQIFQEKERNKKSQKNWHSWNFDLNSMTYYLNILQENTVRKTSKLLQ